MAKRLIIVEKLFYLQNRFKRPPTVKTSSSTMTYEVFNLGTLGDPKNLHIGKDYFEQEKEAYVALFINYKDIFSWSYHNLKTYDTRII